MSKRALVTGATGFVGDHLVERLAGEGWQLRALVRSTSDTASLERHGVERVVGDLGDREAIRRASGGVDVVYHLAAATWALDEAGFVRANVEGTRNVAEGLLRAGPRPQRLVYLSSYAACGPAPPERPRRLADPPAPIGLYGRTKLQGEEIVRSLEQQGVQVVVIRAPAVYGPGDRALLTYFQLVRWGLAPLPSGGERRLHMIYAPNLARALARAAQAPPGTYAVAAPNEHEWSEVVRTIARALKKKPLRVPLPPMLVRAAAAVSETVGKLRGQAVPFNREKAREMLAAAWTCELTGSEVLLGPEEATPLEEGIFRTVQWYRSQGWL